MLGKTHMPYSLDSLSAATIFDGQYPEYSQKLDHLTPTSRALISNEQILNKLQSFILDPQYKPLYFSQRINFVVQYSALIENFKVDRQKYNKDTLSNTDCYKISSDKLDLLLLESLSTTFVNWNRKALFYFFNFKGKKQHYFNYKVMYKNINSNLKDNLDKLSKIIVESTGDCIILLNILINDLYITNGLTLIIKYGFNFVNLSMNTKLRFNETLLNYFCKHGIEHTDYLVNKHQGILSKVAEDISRVHNPMSIQQLLNPESESLSTNVVSEDNNLIPVERSNSTNNLFFTDKKRKSDEPIFNELDPKVQRKM